MLYLYQYVPCSVVLVPVVNFTNISRAAFAPISFQQKFTNNILRGAFEITHPDCKQIKAKQNTFGQKSYVQVLQDWFPVCLWTKINHFYLNERIERSSLWYARDPFRFVFRSQFHQRSKISFYVRRSQKCK